LLAVDEFAFRRGRRYGTIFADFETHQLIDTLPDRSSETLAAWLRDRAGAEIVCCDRASAYTRGAKEAAPDPTEAADRWHLLRNLARAAERDPAAAPSSPSGSDRANDAARRRSGPSPASSARTSTPSQRDSPLPTARGPRTCLQSHAPQEEHV